MYAHGFITVSGEKMSKSRGTGISPLRYLEIGMNPEWLRYYFAAKLNSTSTTSTSIPTTSSHGVNSDLIGKYVNIASRAAGLHHQAFRRRARVRRRCRAPIAAARAAAATVTEHYDTRELGNAMREIMALADRINHDFDARQPWVLAKDPHKRGELQAVCSRALKVFKLLSVLYRARAAGDSRRAWRASFFGLDRPFAWSDAASAARRASARTST